jgi:hypothetical protein
LDISVYEQVEDYANLRKSNFIQLLVVACINICRLACKNVPLSELAFGQCQWIKITPQFETAKKMLALLKGWIKNLVLNYFPAANKI